MFPAPALGDEMCPSKVCQAHPVGRCFPDSEQENWGEGNPAEGKVALVRILLFVPERHTGPLGNQQELCSSRLDCMDNVVI